MNWPALQPFGRKSDVTFGGEGDPFTSFRREMDRLFESFGRQMTWPRELAGVTVAPSVDVSETDKELRIDVELPGVDQKDVDVVVNDNVLTIKGEKKAEKEEKKKDYHMVERSYGSFSRSLTLPFSPEQGQGRLQEGCAHHHAAEAAGGRDQGEEDRHRQRLAGFGSRLIPVRAEPSTAPPAAVRG